MTQQPNLIARQPRRMRQPRKSLLRDALANAATTIADQREIIEHQEAQIASMREAYAALWVERYRRPWWQRIRSSA